MKPALEMTGTPPAKQRMRTLIVYFAVFVLLSGIEQYLESSFYQANVRTKQVSVTRELSVIAARLNGIITNNLSLISGLAAHISIRPDIQQEEFEQYVKAVFLQEPLLINMAAAPNMVVTMIYPLKGNEAALGLDYNKNIAQRDAAHRAITTRNMIVAGPVALVQGGTAFIGRKAVFRENGELWGIVSAPIDALAIYRDAGLTSPQLDIRVALRGNDSLGENGTVFFGDPGLFEDERALIYPMEVGDGSWEIAANPINGWDNTPKTVWTVRLLYLLLILGLLALLNYRFRQIEKEHRYQRMLEKQATFDLVTGLPNRFLFEIQLDKLIAKSTREDGKFAVLFIDLDNFKPVNDNLGHDAGDTLLQQVGDRLKNNIRKSDTLSRYSGDEFIIILQDIADTDTPAKTAQLLLESIARPYRIKDSQVFCTASIGIAMYPEDGKTIEELVSKADQAMYQVKNSGRNSWQYFTKTMQVHSENRHQLYTRLVDAIVHNKLDVYFQPIIELETGRIDKCEALVRWFEGDEQVSTAEFITLAEETGMINEIDRFVLEKATEYLANQEKETNYPIGLSINLSPRLFSASDNSLQQWLKLVVSAKEKIDLTVEITERLLTDQSEKVFEVLQSLRALGVKIAIDDFGVGYSSLSYLIRFPIDTVKIDRSFVDKLGVDKKSEALINAIIDLSHNLSLTIVAEGIETSSQAKYLQDCGCDFGQGYYFNRPMSFSDLKLLIQNSSAESLE